jgi:hypothetical protein
MSSQQHINDYINILLVFNSEHIIKVLWKHKYMEKASLWYLHQIKCLTPFSFTRFRYFIYKIYLKS